MAAQRNEVCNVRDYSSSSGDELAPPEHKLPPRVEEHCSDGCRYIKRRLSKSAKHPEKLFVRICECGEYVDRREYLQAAVESDQSDWDGFERHYHRACKWRKVKDNGKVYLIRFCRCSDPNRILKCVISQSTVVGNEPSYFRDLNS